MGSCWNVEVKDQARLIAFCASFFSSGYQVSTYYLAQRFVFCRESQQAKVPVTISVTAPESRRVGTEMGTYWRRLSAAPLPPRAIQALAWLKSIRAQPDSALLHGQVLGKCSSVPPCSLLPWVVFLWMKAWGGELSAAPVF